MWASSDELVGAPMPMLITLFWLSLDLTEVRLLGLVLEVFTTEPEDDVLLLDDLDRDGVFEDDAEDFLELMMCREPVEKTTTQAQQTNLLIYFALTIQRYGYNVH